MLSLDRKAGQKVYFTVNGVTFTMIVEHIGVNRVKLLFDAPRNVEISRFDTATKEPQPCYP